jgi:hypothetical protein
MKKLLFTLLFLPGLAFSSSMQEYFDNTPSWSEDVEEVIYITTRCSGILQVVGQHRIEVGDQEFGPILLEAGRELGKTSALLALNEGISVENIKERMLYWMKRYADDSTANIDNYNNIFVGDFADDFTVCKYLSDSFNQ